MSLNNGHLPEGAILLAPEHLERATRTFIRCPLVSERSGAEVYVQVRTIRRLGYLLMLPPSPPGSDRWSQDPEAWARHYQEWMESLTPAERRARQAEDAEVTWKVLRAGLVAPVLSEESLVDLADDADHLAREILRFSGLLPTPTEEVPITPA